MPILYPASLDTLTNPNDAGGDTLASVPHDSQHSNANDAIEALEAKLGTGASTPTTAGHFLKVTGAGATGYAAHGLTASDVGAEASGTVATHAADTTAVHGIADTSALATATDVSTAVSNHSAAADPHTGYQKESEKGAVSGYASLDASSKVPFAQLPTGTGASQVATGDHAHALGYSEGTAFPGTPAAGDKFFHNTYDMLFFYDGTRWLSAQRFVASLGWMNGLSSASSTMGVTFGNELDCWLEEIVCSMQVTAPSDGSNYWSCQLAKFNGASSSTVVTVTTASLTAATRTQVRSAINALQGTSDDGYQLDFAKTGTPGALYGAWSLVYRLVGA